MALKDSWNSVKNFFGGNQDDGYEYEEYSDDTYEEEFQQPVVTAPVAGGNGPVASAVKPKTGGYNTVAQRSSGMKVVIVEPKAFEDSENIANQLRDMRPVVINFENTDPHEAARIVDFVSGATFALDGKLEKIGKDIFICVPVNVTVDYTDKEYTEISDKLAWKEPQA
ncbi:MULTISPECIES: cell division protein SepF [unclassified Veillonella]|mgnify:FL=1|uniref:cell division protein SepF n=1 Tax=unclassified Veillonella TaxID=2630086 RepID=UPI000F8CF162|nr:MULTISPECIES: cell division protein SepF [unclassified Veillonella]